MTKSLSKKELRETVRLYTKANGNIAEAARIGDIQLNTFKHRLYEARRRIPSAFKKKFPTVRSHPAPAAPEDLKQSWDAFVACQYSKRAAALKLGLPETTVYRRIQMYATKHRIDLKGKPRPYSPPGGDPRTPPERLRARLKKGSADLEELMKISGLGLNATIGLLDDIKSEGFNLHQFDGIWAVQKNPIATNIVSGHLEFKSDENNRFRFGCVSDNHLCSKYERLDVLNDLYDRFLTAGISRVYNAGNWIDGEAPFNKFDLKVHGLEPQLRYLAAHYPKRHGIDTYAIAGEDHEGWLGRREAIDVGRFAERLMRECGRADWHNIGFMECYVPLVNATTGKTSMMLVMHPGGGSSYATSYRPQKIVESFEGGEKPAVLVIGHYHKLSVNLVRNVWALQIGCTQDQTVFMRKKNLEAHVGGMIVELEQDPKTGAIIGCKTEQIRYFNTGYYNDRWSASDEVTLPKRSALG